MSKHFGEFLSLESGQEVAAVQWKDGGRSVYRVTGKRPYVCKDGREIDLRTWTSECRVCGTTFEIATPMAVEIEGTAFTRRCCDEHKSTQEQCLANARVASAKTRTAAAKVRAAEKATKPKTKASPSSAKAKWFAIAKARAAKKSKSSK